LEMLYSFSKQYESSCVDSSTGINSSKVHLLMDVPICHSYFYTQKSKFSFICNIPFYNNWKHILYCDLFQFQTYFQIWGFFQCQELSSHLASRKETWIIYSASSFVLQIMLSRHQLPCPCCKLCFDSIKQ
jgi:hypothetical protein